MFQKQTFKTKISKKIPINAGQQIIQLARSSVDNLFGQQIIQSNFDTMICQPNEL